MKKILIILGTILIVEGLVALVVLKSPSATINSNLMANETKFTGTITAASFACKADGSCDLTVDGNKYVHFGQGNTGQGPTEWGNADSLWQQEGGVVGKKVEVYAASTGENGYTIQGKKDYYIKIID